MKIIPRYLVSLNLGRGTTSLIYGLTQSPLIFPNPSNLDLGICLQKSQFILSKLSLIKAQMSIDSAVIKSCHLTEPEQTKSLAFF